MSIQCHHLYKLWSACHPCFMCHAKFQDHLTVFPIKCTSKQFWPGSSLYKLWSACHPCFMLNFKIIRYLVLEKLLEGFYYEHGGHLGHVTRTIYTNIFVLPSYGCSTWNLAFIGQVVSEEKIFKKKMVRRTTTTEGSWNMGILHV